MTCRAKAAALQAGAAGDGSGVSAGTYVDIHVIDVPAEAAKQIVLNVETAAKVKVMALHL